MHWAWYAANHLRDSRDSVVCASGITPSGEFHLGHLREILSAEMIHRACEVEGIESKYVFIVDSMDPLRRVYDFLAPEYEEYIGHPLAFIPAPDEDGNPGDGSISFSEHFLAPFLDSLREIGVNFKPENVIRNHQTYESGEFAEKIDEAISKKDEIREKIEDISGRELPSDWFPYNPIGHDGSMEGVKVTAYEKPFVRWVDSSGKEGKSDIRRAQGKLPWRVDWAARWIIHGITCEPFGKDHGAAGGSYDTGKPICELLGGSPPDRFVYEWIQLKGAGPMSSSSGVSIGPMETLEIVPPEVLRYLIARTRMNTHIVFDTGAKLFEIADEYERLRDFITNASEAEEERRGRMSEKNWEIYQKDKSAIELSQLNSGDDYGDEMGSVGFRHLSMLAQIKSSDDDVWASLNRTNHLEGNPGEKLKIRLAKMRAWIEGPHFPEGARLEIRRKVSEEARKNLDDGAMTFLSVLSSRLSEIEWEGWAIAQEISEAADSSGISRREGYAALYWSLLERSYGPRASSLLCEMKREEVVTLLESAK